MQLILAVILTCWYHGLATPNVTVAPNGSGNFRTISEAIMAAPSNSMGKFHIMIRAGVYQENIFIGPEKTNLVLVGEGKDKTVISGNRSFVGGFQTADTATVAVYASGFAAQDITFENVAGPEAHQAVALLTQADFLAFFRCGFKGYQDTLYTKHGYQFFRECEITGTVDFIFGDAAVIFQTCIIYVQRPLPEQVNTITAQRRDNPSGISGIVIMNSNIIATEDLRQQIPRAKTYLGRPWKKFSRTVILQSFLDDIIAPEGWLQWENHGVDPVFYAEYKNTGPGANTTRRVPWAKTINSPADAAAFTVRKFIHGDAWIPSDVPFFPDLSPQLQATSSGKKRQQAIDELMATQVFLVLVVFYLIDYQIFKNQIRFAFSKTL